MQGTEKWCTQPGNDANTGKAPNLPKATITNLLKSYTLNPGDVIYIDSGIYNEAPVITNKGNQSSNIIFIGAGISNTIINGAGGTSWQNGALTLNYAKYILIKGFKLKCIVIDNPGIHIKNSSYITVISNLAISNSRTGIRLDSVTNAFVAYNILYYNNQINDQWPSGIQLNNSISNIIKSNICKFAARGLFLENNSKYNTISENTLTSNECGIMIKDAGTISNYIKLNFISFNTNNTNHSENEGVGINIWSPYNIIISNRIWTNNKGIEIDQNARESFIIANRIYKNKNEAISLFRARNYITNNLIYSNYGKGIYVNWDGNTNFIKYNKIYKNSHGIEMENNVKGNFIFKNELYNNTWDGVAGLGCDLNSIISNEIYGNGAAGISFYDKTNSENKILGNNIRKNSGAGIYIVGDKNILKYNSIYSNNNEGISINGLNLSYFTNEFNIIYDNNNEGIKVTDSGVNSIVKNCTLFRNKSDGLKLQSGSLIVKNCISAWNTTNGYNQVSGSLTIKYSDSYNNTGGAFGGASTTNCIEKDPKFISISPGNSEFLKLSGYSPCINSGDPSDSVPTGGGTRIDMGVYEYQVPPAPKINSLSTNKIGRGEKINIFVNNFGSTQYLSTVSFSNAINGKVIVSNIIEWSNNFVKLIVPLNLEINTTNSITIKTWGGEARTNNAIIIINSLPQIILTGPNGPTVNPTKGKKTTQFNFKIYYKDIENDPPYTNYPKVVTIVDGNIVQTNIMLTNTSSGSWTNGRLCEATFTIPYESENITNFFILKARTGNKNEYISPKFKLISRIGETVLSVTNIKKVSGTLNSITISWNIREPHIASQSIFINTTSPATNGISYNLSPSINSFKIENLSPAKNYYIIIRTYDDLGNYSDSEEVILRTEGAREPTERVELWNNLLRENEKLKIFINPTYSRGNIKIEVYTLYGKIVRQLLYIPIEHLLQPIEWDGTDDEGKRVPAGVYLIYIKASDFNEVKRVYILR
jgi:parallel beta-helix repeat protein